MKNRVYKIVRNVAGKLRQELGTTARLLVFIVEPFSGELVACWPRTEIPALAPTSQELLRQCIKRERSILIQSKTDPLLQSLPETDFGSALCVPLADSDRNVVGVIYADHPESGAFANTHRLQIERMARDMQASLPRVGVPIAGPAPEAVPTSAWASRAGLAVVALFGVFLVFWLLAPADQPIPPPTANDLKPQRWVSDPTAVVNSFNQLLASREFEQAWDLLHPELQAALPVDIFQARATGWLSEEAHRWEFPRRTLRMGTSTPDEAICYIDPPPDLEALASWEWSLKPLDAHWRITAMRGGPLSASSNER